MNCLFINLRNLEKTVLNCMALSLLGDLTSTIFKNEECDSDQSNVNSFVEQ